MIAVFCQMEGINKTSAYVYIFHENSQKFLRTNGTTQIYSNDLELPLYWKTPFLLSNGDTQNLLRRNKREHSLCISRGNLCSIFRSLACFFKKSTLLSLAKQDQKPAGHAPWLDMRPTRLEATLTKGNRKELLSYSKNIWYIHAICSYKKHG